MAEAQSTSDCGGTICDELDGQTDHFVPPTTLASDEEHKLPDSSSSIDGESICVEQAEVQGDRKLQKKDSGIDVEKSPSTSTRDGLSSDADCGDSVSECYIDSTGLSLSHSESVSETKSEDSPVRPEDSGDISFFLDNADSSPNNGNVATDTQDTDEVEMADLVTSSGTDVTVGDDVEVDDCKDVKDVSSRRKRHREYGLSSSSDSDSDSDDSVSRGRTGRLSDKKKDSDTQSEEDTEMSAKPWPKHKWRALYDLRKRETGLTNRIPPSCFREKVQGSLQMTQRLKLQYRMEYHEGCVNALHFNRIGTLLASGSDDLHIVLWNWVRNRKALVYDSGHRSNVFQAKFMPFSGDCHVVSCARDGQVRLAELSLTGRCKNTKRLAQHRGAAHKLALEYDSPHVFLSCGEDALTYEIDLREDKPHKLVVTKENDTKVALYSIHSNPVNSYEFCTGGRDHYIRVYDKRKIAEGVNGGVLKKFCPEHLVNSHVSVKANVTCACYNYNGTEILGSYNDEDIYLFDDRHSDGASHIHRYIGHRNNATVKGVNFYGPRSEFIVSGSDCGHVFIWDKETERIAQFMEADDCGVVNCLEPHPFAPVLATSGLDHDVKIWAPTSHQPTNLSGLAKVTRKNKRERERDRSHEPEMIDGQMLWHIMHHFRRSARRRLRQEGEDVSSSSDNSDSDSNDDDEGMPDRMQCHTS